MRSGYPAMKSPTSHHPLSAPAGTPKALSLKGVWVGVGDSENGPLKHKNSGIESLQIVILPPEMRKTNQKKDSPAKNAGIHRLSNILWLPCMEFRLISTSESVCNGSGDTPRGLCPWWKFSKSQMAHSPGHVAASGFRSRRRTKAEASLGMGGLQPEDHQNSQNKQKTQFPSSNLSPSNHKFG